MKAFVSFTGTILPLNRGNVDTDAIIPKQYLKSIQRSGFGAFLFDDWRYLDPGTLLIDPATRRPNPDFILNHTDRKGVSILLARDNFGCGSSREHAVWALMDYGIRAVIADSYSDIFFSNAAKNGLLPITLAPTALNTLFVRSLRDPALSLTVSLQEQCLSDSSGWKSDFHLPGDVRDRLLQGLDDIALTLSYESAIRSYERKHRKHHPWLFEP